MGKRNKTKKISTFLCNGDLPDEALRAAQECGIVAWDIETSGLDWANAVIATCQIFVPNNGVFVVKITDASHENMTKLLRDSSTRKVFHHALFDLRFMAHHWNARAQNIACTKIASKILSPNQDKHSLQYLLSRYLDVSIEKGLQTSNWLAEKLSNEQLAYAANDVLYLIELLDILIGEIQKEKLMDLLVGSFSYIPCRVALDLRGSGDVFTY